MNFFLSVLVHGVHPQSLLAYFKFTLYMAAGTYLIVEFCVRIEACVKYLNIFMNNSTEQPFLGADNRLAIKTFSAFHGT
jgi:hypothetical protein